MCTNTHTDKHTKTNTHCDNTEWKKHKYDDSRISENNIVKKNQINTNELKSLNNIYAY